MVIEGKLGWYKKLPEEKLGDLIDEAVEKAINVRPVPTPDDPWKLFACLIIKYLKETLGDVTVRFETDKQDKKLTYGEVRRFAGSTDNTFYTMCCYVPINHSESHCPKCNRSVNILGNFR